MAKGMMRLEAGEVVTTLDHLHARISERFPASGLSRVCARLTATARETARRARRLSRPYLALRLPVAAIVLAALALPTWLIVRTDWLAGLRGADVLHAAEGLEPAVNLALLSAGAVWFLLSLEARWKRARVHKALHELRSFAHVVDMHQLTKDPTLVLGPRTASSPAREMSRFELARYLDYCAEMLALTAKLAALYAGENDDPAILAAVNDIETLTSDLGRKIWQKIMILGQLDEAKA
ncbi:hypothetical protein DMC25_08060 [Caulobacter sp. D4A]|uniref:hypothetical protein n=1 Tax=unclassified Caulobacter TaxID=2648921 RepID=UPI000D72E436|nr:MULTISPECIES: hypothetical protein [unclassified Caulobacter]PXA90263.1 hypothetical protein DMC25_08060 [Caulobacter sp. D4A]PXA96411.1 hypothetical protein DMC18_01455 [Caulobacter sp. D5]